MLAVTSMGLIRFTIDVLVIAEPPIAGPFPLSRHDDTAAEPI
jgi:hypothetical protein